MIFSIKIQEYMYYYHYTLYIDVFNYKRENKSYRRVLLRDTQRENGKTVYKTLANLSHISDIEVAALKLAFKEKNNLAYLQQLTKIKCTQGKIVGPVFVLNQLAHSLGLVSA